MQDPAVRQQALQEEEMTRISRDFKQLFSTPLGKGVLDVIVTKLCRSNKQLPLATPSGPNSEGALYWGGRGDVGRAIQELIDYEPRESAVVVKTKRDGQ
jgi:hypothetical protein